MMIANLPPTRRRPGVIMPVVALLLVCLCGFTALSVEVAMMATVKIQCQNAADSAALAGARTLNGGATSSTSQAQANALTAAAANSALGWNSSGTLAVVPFASTEVSTTCGTYHYNTTSQTFYPAYTLQSGEDYNLVSATVKRVVKNNFFSVDGGTSNASTTPTIVATAVAAHRPRDVAVVLDFSGSMNNESDLWNCESYLGSLEGLSNNSDPVVPAFGHYSSSSTALVSSSAPPGGSCNLTQSVYGMPPLVNSYFSTLSSVSPGTSAFTAALTAYGTQPMGDVPVYTSNAGSGSFAQTANNIFGTSYTTSILKNSAADAFENGSVSTASQGSNNLATAGYNNLYTLKVPPSPSGKNQLGVAGFSGFTEGPGYWGKTFFQWPPDPRPTKDWRQLYFLTPSGSAVNDNTVLFGSGSDGSWNDPYNSSMNYQVNYKAILNWIVNVGPNPFPPMLQAGRNVYYSTIPTDVPASAYNHNNPNSAITNNDQRFWKEYIDYCLGSWRDPYGNIQNPGSPTMSYGPDYNWGTVQISARPSGTPPNGSKLAYMNYNDNPQRPRHRMWFGPMTMLQYIADTGINPGTARDISTFSTKLGIASVLQDIQINHPNDQVSMILYNRPQYSNEPPVGNYTQAMYNLNTNYAAMTNSLWYPPNSTTAGVSPWDANGSQTPDAFGDYTSNTTTNHGLMLAYNQFSGSSTLSAASIGGLGRVGAKRLVILETDGMANNNTSTGFTNNGGTNSYYNILPTSNLTATGYDQNALLQVVQAICNTSTGTPGTPNSAVTNPGYPGFATSNKPVVVQTIAFGIVFQISTSTQTSAVGLLQAISQIGGTTFPSSPTDPTNGYKWCIGTLSTRVQLLQQAFANALNDGNSVSLVQ
jgi:Flp pilus assembly protein TadG